MPVYPILHRWTGIPIGLIVGETFPEALARAARHPGRLLYADLAAIRVPSVSLPKADLRGADLSHSDLSGGMLAGADLRTARLVGACLRESCLHSADLRQADLRQADLRQADLEDARLVGGDLRGALLRGANLRGAVLDWRWSELPLEILRQHQEAARQGSKVVAALAFDDNAHEFAWLKAVLHLGPGADWALRIFAQWIRRGDNAPELMRKLVADLQPISCGSNADLMPSDGTQTPMLWIRRAPVRDAIAHK
jgi:hypothetical protein